MTDVCFGDACRLPMGRFIGGIGVNGKPRESETTDYSVLLTSFEAIISLELY